MDPRRTERLVGILGIVGRLELNGRLARICDWYSHDYQDAQKRGRVAVDFLDLPSGPLRLSLKPEVLVDLESFPAIQLDIGLGAQNPVLPFSPGTLPLHQPPAGQKWFNATAEEGRPAGYAEAERVMEQSWLKGQNRALIVPVEDIHRAMVPLLAGVMNGHCPSIIHFFNRICHSEGPSGPGGKLLMFPGVLMLRRACDDGWPLACYRLAVSLFNLVIQDRQTPLPVDNDYYALLQRAFDGGVAMAGGLLGSELLEGAFGISGQRERALQVLRQAAAQDDVFAKFELYQVAEIEDEENSLLLLEQCAKADYLPAMGSMAYQLLMWTCKDEEFPDAKKARAYARERGQELVRRMAAVGFNDGLFHAEQLQAKLENRNPKVLDRFMRRLCAQSPHIRKDGIPSWNKSWACAVCGKFETKLCAKCKNVRYCSAAHQRQHWSEHKLQCGKPN